MSLEVRASVNWASIKRDIDATLSQMKLGKHYVLSGMAMHGMHFMRRIMRKKTGKMAREIYVKVTENRARVIPYSPYTIFQDKGTPASPGRYVPVLGKRLVNPAHPSFGMHPGIKGQQFTKQTHDEIIAYGRAMAERLFGSVLK